jgi:hypothetical protein
VEERVSFIGGGNRGTRRKSSTCRKSLAKSSYSDNLNKLINKLSS